MITYVFLVILFFQQYIPNPIVTSIMQNTIVTTIVTTMVIAIPEYIINTLKVMLLITIVISSIYFVFTSHKIL